MRNLNVMNEQETRETNGGHVYQCRHCGFVSSNYWTTYKNALKCVTRKYGYKVYKIVSSILPK